MHIRSAPETVDAVMARFALLAEGVPDLPADADRTPPGPIAGQWVNVSGRSADDAGVVLYLHGGGFAHTEPRAEALMAYHLSRAAGRPVVALDYRLAPEHACPVAIEDVVAAHGSLLAHGAKEIVLFGESAGGTLALSALLAIKGAGAPLPKTVAVSPLTDLTLSSPSLRHGGPDLIDRTVLARACADYLAGARPDAPPQSPLFGDLRGLPPLLLAAGGAEVLLDDARRFAAAAEAAGVQVELDVYEGMPHVFHLALLTGAPLPTTTTFLRRFAAFTRERHA